MRATSPDIRKKSTAVAAASADDRKATQFDTEVGAEFGGPIGNFSIIVVSHILVYFIWSSLKHNGGHFYKPWDGSDLRRFVASLHDAAPTWYAFCIYWTFMVSQAVLSVIMPGVSIKGLKFTEAGFPPTQLTYLCNGYLSFYATLLIVGALHVTGTWRLTEVVLNIGPITSVAVISGNVVSLLVWAAALLNKRANRRCGNFIYDFFMGIYLNPRIGKFDIKFFFELRVAWIMLFLITLAHALQQYEDYGVVSNGMWIMVYAHWLYGNACMKGEECVPSSWDIFFENFGWMLCWWNAAGVPLVYCAQAIYIYNHPPVDMHPNFFIALVIVLTIAYYIFDTANSQKNRFRMMMSGTYIPRSTFPQLPWGTLTNPKYMTTKAGSALLVDGWYGFCRKPHYLADWVMATCWGLACGFDSTLPYLYSAFFAVMIIHRTLRDEHRCSQKYGDDWVEYKRRVPHVFIPGVI